MGIDFPDRQLTRVRMRYIGFKGLDVELDAHGKINGLVGIVERVFVNNKAYCNCRALFESAWGEIESLRVS